MDQIEKMRKLVAKTILENPIKYDAQFLGRNMDPARYAKWIQLPNSWGGIPELHILSEHYEKIICVVNIRDEKMHKFGDEGNKNEIIFLLYNGVHYNLGIYKK